MRSQVHLTSAAVNGLPSCHFTPCRRWKSSLVPSSSQAQSVASSGTMSERLFCATRWSNSTRLFITAIIGRSATTVVSSWIDMLAGLSIMYCLRIPPCFWASAAGAAETAISRPAATARLKNRRVISVFLPLVVGLSSRGRRPRSGRGCQRNRLFVEPDIFHAPAVVDAIDHDRVALDLGAPAARAAVVVDD